MTYAINKFFTGTVDYIKNAIPLISLKDIYDVATNMQYNTV